MKKRKENHTGLLAHVKRDLSEYFSGTTVHGFRYVVAGRNRKERGAWMMFILFGFFFCSQSVYQMYQHWEEHPVETTIDEVGLPISELPFPAITVCDTDSLKMPRRNRWMFLETLLNSLSLKNPKEQTNDMFPGKYISTFLFWMNIVIA